VSPRTALAADGRSSEAGRVAVLERRGKFLVAEPFFGSGQRFTVSRDKRAEVGDLVLLRADSVRGGRGGRASIARRIGKPTIARDVIEALMIDRGLRRSFDPAVDREARSAVEVREAELSSGGARRDLRDVPTFTRRPRATSTTRFRAPRRVALGGASGCTSPTCPRSCPRSR
jgi:ribonuclease R